MDTEITVEIQAADPGEFFNAPEGHLPMPEGVFIHVGKYEGPGIAVTVRGPHAAVVEFIAHHWGEDEVQSMREFGTLPYSPEVPAMAEAIEHCANDFTHGKPDQRDMVRAALAAADVAQDDTRDERIANYIYEDMGETIVTVEQMAEYILSQVKVCA